MLRRKHNHARSLGTRHAPPIRTVGVVGSATTATRTHGPRVLDKFLSFKCQLLVIVVQTRYREVSVVEMLFGAGFAAKLGFSIHL